MIWNYDAFASKDSSLQIKEGVHQAIKKAVKMSSKETQSQQILQTLWICSVCLQIVFMGTEVAPWSKVGGLGDVLSALPISLADRGHDVMTVVPRYEFYPDVSDTGTSQKSEFMLSLPGLGLVIPITGKTESHENADKESGWSRLFHSFTKGVHRVFVDHPIFRGRAQHRKDCSQSRIYPYGHHKVDQEEFEIGCSVLNQSACLAPALIWNGELGVDTNHKKNAVKKDLRWMRSSEISMLLEDLGIEDHDVDTDLVEEQEGYCYICNDWPCALLPSIARSFAQNPYIHCKCPDHINCQEQAEQTTSSIPGNMQESLSASRVIFLIHNAEHIGPNFHQSIKNLNLDHLTAVHLSTTHKITEWSRNTSVEASWLHMGVKHSDAVLTVSPSYAQELSTSSGGCMRHQQERPLCGIMNGLDTQIWNPQMDPFLNPSCYFGVHDLKLGKAKMKRGLQKELGLAVKEDQPLFGFIGRLDNQKGVDLLLIALLKFLTRSHGAQEGQFVLLGCGDATLEAHFKAIQYWFPGQAIGLGLFSERLAHQITASCDFLIIPSRMEPCGLVALSALRYGTIPIAPSIGGLKDAMQRSSWNGGFPPIGIQIGNILKTGVGSVDSAAEAIVDALNEALILYGNKDFRKEQRRCMFMDVSWDPSSRKWEKFLQSIV